MKRFSEQLNKKSKSVKLVAAERQELRTRVVSYMEYHPMPASFSKKATTAVNTPIESFTTIPFSRLFKWGAVAAVFVLLVIPVMAERTVPGDGLYAIKVKFNEEVRSTLALTTYQKIEWETERVNRRIAEARLLASEGKLTAEVETEVAAAIKTHTDNAKREIEQLRTEDEEEASIATLALTSTLQIQSTSLKEDETNGSDENRPTNLIASVIDEGLAAQPVADTMPGYDKLMARVETNTTRIYEILKALNLNNDSNEYKEIARRAGDIERSVQEAIGARETSDEGARMILVDSLQRTQKLIVFMSEIQTNQSFVVEDFVPAVLTKEEQIAKIETYKNEVQAQKANLQQQIASSSNTAVFPKAKNTIVTVESLQKKMSGSSDVKEITAWRKEAVALISDTRKMLNEKPVTDETTEDSTGTEEEVTGGTEEGTLRSPVSGAQ